MSGASEKIPGSAGPTRGMGPVTARYVPGAQDLIATGLSHARVSGSRSGSGRRTDTRTTDLPRSAVLAADLECEGSTDRPRAIRYLGGRRASRVGRMEWSSGAIIAERYRLEDRLGSGGMGEVWEATHLFLERPVAIKLLHRETPVIRARLVREARSLARLRHPAIVEVFDSGELADGTPFVVLERLYGDTLSALLRVRGRLPAAQCVRWFALLADGLFAAHNAGVIHRDVKPSNIFIADGQPKLLDFGVARLSNGTDVALTAVDALVGTPSYMAPEQFLGDSVDPRTDVWGLVATLYEAITGTPPFEGPSVVEVMRRVLEAPVPYPRHVAEIDGGLWKIFARGLDKQPSGRFQTAAELRDALSHWLAEDSNAPEEKDERTPPRVAPISEPDEDAPPSLDEAIRSKLQGE